MAYGPNTSRTNRLPHGFFENLYARLEESGALLRDMEQSMPPDDINELVELLQFFDTQLRRQRQSHLGMEST